MSCVLAMAMGPLDQRGATSVEYAVIAGLIAVGIVFAVTGIGAALVTIFTDASLLNAL